MTVDGWAIERSSGRDDGSMAIEPGALEFHKELILVAGEAFARVKELVEAANKCFVEVAHAAHDGIQTVFYLLCVLGFQIVVDQYHHREGESFRSENIDSLLNVVLKDAELVFAKIRHQTARAVFDRNWQNHQIRIHRNLCSRFAEPREVRRSGRVLRQRGWFLDCMR